MGQSHRQLKISFICCHILEFFHKNITQMFNLKQISIVIDAAKSYLQSCKTASCWFIAIRIKFNLSYTLFELDSSCRSALRRKKIQIEPWRKERSPILNKSCLNKIIGQAFKNCET